MQAIDNWRRTGSAAQRDLALDRSAGAVADILQLNANGVYPKISLVFSHVQILTARLVILGEADPHFGRSEIARKSVVDGISLIRSCVAELQQGIATANRIKSREWVTSGPFPPGHGPRPTIHHFSIDYSNVSRTSAFNRKYQSEFEIDTSGPMAAAQAAQAKGVADDTAAARIPELAAAADQFEKTLSLSELQIISAVTGRVMSAIEVARYAQLRRFNTLGDSTRLLLQDWAKADTDKLNPESAVTLLTGKQPTEADQRLFKEVMDRFGPANTLALWLGRL
jgi:hypothetical protein